MNHTAPIEISPPDGTWISDAVLTPWAAYSWLRKNGIQHEQALALTRNRGIFEFFLECVSST